MHQDETIVAVEFIKEKVTAYVLRGTTISEAAERKNIILNVACGGVGTCGKCKVRVEGNAVSPPSAEEKALLGDTEIEAGFRLACQAKAEGTIRVYVFADATFSSAQIMESGTLDGEIHLDPCVTKHYMTFTEPTLENSLAYNKVIEKGVGTKVNATPYTYRRITHALHEGNFSATAVVRKCDNRLICVEPGDTREKNYAIAFDLGTTTVVGTLLDLNHGRDVVFATRMNGQHVYGLDVISRIRYAGKEDGLNNLHNAVIRTINEIIEEIVTKAGIDRTNIYELAVSGNTTMLHLFLRIPVHTLSAIPFVPVVTRSQEVPAKDLGIDIHHEAVVFTLPIVGGFVGGDTTACILASGMHKSEKVRMLVDIGTNGEIAIGNKDFLLTSSAPAGPAFEGAQIKFGMRGIRGAIEKVVFTDDVVKNVIGNALPIGICGSGLIDAIANLLRAGIVSETGELLPPKDVPESVPEKIRKRLVADENGDRIFIIAHKGQSGPIYITQKDIRELQLAKGAIASIIDMLIKEANVTLDDIETFYIAGAFGNYIRAESAKGVGLIPDLPDDRIRFIGNAALVGSKMALLSSAARKDLVRLSDRAVNVEFGGRPDFQMSFADAMLFS